MKNGDSQNIKQARMARSHKAALTDILVNPEVVQINMRHMNQQPRRKRRVNYVKKIMNDPFIFSV